MYATSEVGEAEPWDTYKFPSSWNFTAFALGHLGHCVYSEVLELKEKPCSHHIGRDVACLEVLTGYALQTGV